MCVCASVFNAWKHYDLLKIYAENTLQTDKNRLQTTSVIRKSKIVWVKCREYETICESSRVYSRHLHDVLNAFDFDSIE